MDEIDKKALDGAMKRFYEQRNPTPSSEQSTTTASPPTMPKSFNAIEFEKKVSQNTDPDLTVGFEIVKLPSKGLFYPNNISEVLVEYMTSKDEDILSTYSLIENGTVFDILLKNKVKVNGISPDDLLLGDRNAILLFLRASSYGKEYEVRVRDPRSGNFFNAKVDLTLLKYKEIKEMPDEKMEYTFELPTKKKIVKFKILNNREIDGLLKTAQSRKDAFGTPYSEFNTLKLKSEIVEINSNRDKTYIGRFIDAMPIMDSVQLKKKILEVTPDVDTTYSFKATDGYEFTGLVSIGIDFFFPFN